VTEKLQDLVVPIKYMGGKPDKHDTVNHTGTVWQKGQTLPYPARLAKALLVHTGVWRLGKREDIKEGSDDVAAVEGTAPGTQTPGTGASGQGREFLNDRTRESDPAVSKLATNQEVSTKGSRRTLE
jgi:hypothetical protein